MQLAVIAGTQKKCCIAERACHVYSVLQGEMDRMPLSHLVFRIANISDPVLKGKVAKAIGILQRTFALYK